MTDDEKLMQRALDALEVSTRFVYADLRPQCVDAIVAMRERLAQPEPDAVLAEREACAKLVEDSEIRWLTLLAASIRARGQSCPPCNHDCDEGRTCPARHA